MIPKERERAIPRARARMKRTNVSRMAISSLITSPRGRCSFMNGTGGVFEAYSDERVKDLGAQHYHEVW